MKAEARLNSTSTLCYTLIIIIITITTIIIIIIIIIVINSNDNNKVSAVGNAQLFTPTAAQTPENADKP